MNPTLSLMEKIKDGILSVLFPLYCVDCGAEGAWCCEDCLEMIARTAVLKCPLCGKEFPAGRTCAKCANRTGLSGLIAAASYADPGVRRLVKALKFDGALGVLPIINRLAVHGRGVVVAAVPAGAIVVPMPLHGKRERVRGYNQSEMLARNLFTGFYIEAGRLKRIKNTVPQTELKDEARLTNISGAFGAERKFNGETILLVDDVYTTGATMNEAARVLKEAGAGEVWGFVIARG